MMQRGPCCAAHLRCCSKRGSAAVLLLLLVLLLQLLHMGCRYAVECAVCAFQQ
jgi:hypothetical protein